MKPEKQVAHAKSLLAQEEVGKGSRLRNMQRKEDIREKTLCGGEGRRKQK